MIEIVPRSLNLDLIGKKKIFLVFSLVLVLLSLFGLVTKGLSYGIDFVGGAEVQIGFVKPISVEILRQNLETSGFLNVIVQRLGEENESNYLIKTNGDKSQLKGISKAVESSLEKLMPHSEFEVRKVDVVGPGAGVDLKNKGFFAILFALVCILVYVSIRFGFFYGPAAVVALVHDTIVLLGVYVFLEREFSLQTVAAMLTVIGYSNNDTIIVFDRIRETLRLHPYQSLRNNINRSVSETLSRTVLTSVCTLMVVGSLLIFGGATIHEFSFALFVGIIIGTYSSIFVATPIVVILVQFVTSNRGSRKVLAAPIQGDVSDRSEIIS
ncbi:MAG: protein translocase subunit SecF [Bacteriovoracia bacterium]